MTLTDKGEQLVIRSVKVRTAPLDERDAVIGAILMPWQEVQQLLGGLDCSQLFEQHESLVIVQLPFLAEIMLPEQLFHIYHGSCTFIYIAQPQGS